MTQKNIVIAVGGTAGHVYPAKKLAENLLQKHPSWNIEFLGDKIESNIYLKGTSLPSVDIPSGSLSLRSFFKDVLNILQGITKAKRYFKKKRPDLVIGFGSYHTFPILCVSFFQKVPYVLVEANAILGKMNRFFKNHAHKVAYRFFDVPEKNHPQFEKVDTSLEKVETYSKEEALSFFGLEKDVLTLLITGGSQGALTLNKLLLDAMNHLKDIKFQVIHLIGFNTDATSTIETYKKLGIKACVKVYEEKMDIAYSAVDKVISRAGAGAVVEQMQRSLPSLLIPFPFLKDKHQHANAIYACHNYPGTKMLEQKELAPEVLAEHMRVFLTQKRLHNTLERQEKNRTLEEIVEEALLCRK